MMSSEVPNVRLRAMEPEDLDFLYNMENDREVWQVGVTNVPYSRFLLHEYMSSASGDIFTDKQLRLMIDVDGQCVGICDLVNFSPRHQRAEVGIVVKKNCRRHGYATEALHQLTNYALHVLNLHQIYAVVACANNDAVRLFRRCGFSQETPLRGWIIDGKQASDALLMQFFSHN